MKRRSRWDETPAERERRRKQEMQRRLEFVRQAMREQASKTQQPQTQR